MAVLYCLQANSLQCPREHQHTETLQMIFRFRLTKLQSLLTPIIISIPYTPILQHQNLIHTFLDKLRPLNALSNSFFIRDVCLTCKRLVESSLEVCVSEGVVAAEVQQLCRWGVNGVSWRNREEGCEGILVYLCR